MFVEKWFELVHQTEALKPQKEAIVPQKEALKPQKGALVPQKGALVPQKEAHLPQKEALLQLCLTRMHLPFDSPNFCLAKALCPGSRISTFQHPVW